MTVPTPTITIQWLCALCGVRDAPLAVPERGEEDVIAWMEATLHHVRRAHTDRSPRCPVLHVDLKIPTDYRSKIGGPIQH
jgi:hypothetical protein